MGQLGVLIKLVGQLLETIVSEHVFVQHDGSKVRIRSQIEREHAQTIIMDTCTCEINRSYVIVADQFECGLNQTLWLLAKVQARVIVGVILNEG